MKCKIQILLLLLLPLLAICQEPIYFNNIYNPENTFANGRGILQIDGYYYGIFGTWTAPNYYYQLGVFKLSSTGELLDYNLFGEEGHHYFVGSVGGTLIQTQDGNLAAACQVQNSETVFGTLLKINLALDTLWQRKYYTEYEWTMTEKVQETSDGGFMLVGQVDPGEGYFYDALLLRTDSLGNEIWHKAYGSDWSEQAYSVIETSDGGYMIGGFFRKPGWDHSLDAMVIKTDSLGNEEWTNYYGNPEVDDDKAFVMGTEDGNYLVATVYGETILSAYRIGGPWFFKLDNLGNIIDEFFWGPQRMDSFIMNIRKVEDGFVTSGFSYETDSSTSALYTGWLMKINNNMDSVWYHDYLHFGELYDDNFLYDISGCEDDGYIAIGKARHDVPGFANKMWVIKVDSMGCDTPGCALGTQVFELPSLFSNELIVWPNPMIEEFEVRCPMFEVDESKILRVYNSQGIKVDKIEISKNADRITVNSSDWEPGLYFLQYLVDGNVQASAKVIKNN
jgi:hypothetical protein